MEVVLVMCAGHDVVEVDVPVRVLALARKHDLERHAAALLERTRRLDPRAARAEVGDAREARAVAAARLAESHAGQQPQIGADGSAFDIQRR